jgi:sulfopyruvate decarboxylase TPP-binding subunit
MGRATQATMEAVGITVFRADTPEELIETVDQAASMAFDADQQVAVLISQRLLGRKKW